MNETAIQFAGSDLVLRASGALWWPDAQLLCVSDLHLGKSERIARRGGTLLPPFETRDTLSRLEAEITALDPAHVICLGDSFDDMTAARGLGGEERGWIARLMDTRDWTWIEGNHDPAPTGFGGRATAECKMGALCFRHIAGSTSDPGEISGHYHPKVILHGRGRTVRRPAFLFDSRRLILPAFGTFTGGLDVRDAAFATLMGPDARAVLTGKTMACLPVGWAASKVD